jgi:hypothetical protein
MNEIDTQGQQPPGPDPALRLLDRFVGTRDMNGRTVDSDGQRCVRHLGRPSPRDG